MTVSRRWPRRLLLVIWIVGIGGLGATPTGCVNGGFFGSGTGGKKKVDTPEAANAGSKPQPTQATNQPVSQRPPAQQQQQSEYQNPSQPQPSRSPEVYYPPYQPQPPSGPPVVINPPPPQPVFETVPVVPPPPSRPPPPVGEPLPGAAGIMELALTAFANMEHGFHALDEGYRATLTDDAGVVASAALSPQACRGAVPMDAPPGQAYSQVLLKPAAQYIRAGATSGQARLTICKTENFDAIAAPAQCADKSQSGVTSSIGEDSERRTTFDGNVSYSVSPGAAGLARVAIESGAPGMSAWHPVFSFACPSMAFKDFQSPLVIDLSHNQRLDLIDVWDDGAAKVYFDLDGTGTRRRSGWVSPKDGFLVLDRDRDGMIRDGRELFGEASELGGHKRFDNGFAALATLDVNRDGWIDAKDPQFDELKVWRDANRDGLSQPMELKTISAVGVARISLAYEVSGTREQPTVIAGNELRLISHLVMKSGEIRLIGDVWFKQRRTSDISFAVRGDL